MHAYPSGETAPYPVPIMRKVQYTYKTPKVHIYQKKNMKIEQNEKGKVAFLEPLTHFTCAIWKSIDGAKYSVRPAGDMWGS